MQIIKHIVIHKMYVLSKQSHIPFHCIDSAQNEINMRQDMTAEPRAVTLSCASLGDSQTDMTTYIYYIYVLGTSRGYTKMV